MKLEYDFRLRCGEITDEERALSHSDLIALFRTIDPKVEHIFFRVGNRRSSLCLWPDGQWLAWLEGDQMELCDDGLHRLLGETWQWLSAPYSKLKLVGV